MCVELRITNIEGDEITVTDVLHQLVHGQKVTGRQAVIIEKRGDQPVVSNHKFVLIDVELHPLRPSVQVDFVRAAYVVPEAFTRSNLSD